ncbi:MAG: methyltransferase domain-containing protein [Chloroflexi bacterium]|nr:methyltransferase domain-containing protein [Chloroflexota bacterium]
MNLYDILACPICKTGVELVDSHLSCIECKREYPIVNGVPIMMLDWNETDVQHERELIVRDEYNPWIERMIMQSLTDNQVVVDAGSGNMLLDDPCVIRMDVKLTPHVDVVGDLHAFPFKSSSVDFVFALAVFEHLRQPFIAAEEIYRALKPGGYVYAECNFVYAYHGYPHHYFNASIQGLQQLFAQFKELRVGVAPYQMPSFTLENVLGTYQAFFKASNLTELMFVWMLNSLLQFPLRHYDSKFTSDTAFRIAAGDYFMGSKQPNGNDTIIPPVIIDIYSRVPELQTRYPDPVNLVSPDNLMTWAKTEGTELYPDIAKYFSELQPFIKYTNPARSSERKIQYRPDILHPDSQQHIGGGDGDAHPLIKVFCMLFEKLIAKIKTEGLLGFIKRTLIYLRRDK